MVSDNKDLIAAHEAMAAVLDAKFSNVKEWQAFRHIDRLLITTLEKQPAVAPPAPAAPVRRLRARLSNEAPIPYMTLADSALSEAGQPQTTAALMTYIGQRRKLGSDPEKARIVVQSSLSKDERFKSIPWEGGRAWWYANKPTPTPKKESANLL